VFVVDTNILLYAADRNAPEHVACRKLLLEWRKQPSAWYLTWGIVYEFIRVSTHPRIFQKPWNVSQAWQFIQTVLASQSIGLLTQTNRHAQVAKEVFKQIPLLSGNIIFDAHTAILMKEHGIKKIYTRDTDFHRFPFLEAVDPLQ
jgi:hypothetical protein